jgi:hypothetical protein
MAVTITEDFEHDQGRFVGYETYDDGQRAAIRNQRHVDLASFVVAPTTYQAVNETWSTPGDITTVSSRHHWPGLVVACSAGSQFRDCTYIEPINLLTGFQNTDAISFACPSFPLAALTLASCQIRLTEGINTATVNFGQSTTIPIAGDTELRFPRSLFTGLNLAAVDAMRITLVATGSCTFTCTGARLLGANWTYAPVDINTQSGRLVNPSTLNGSATRTYTFPANTFSDPRIPTDFPIMLRADTPSGKLDPRPVNATLQAGFFTGSKLENNSLRLYFREFPEALLTQIDLDLVSQSDLDDLGVQPDYAVTLAAYSLRTQAYLDQFNQSELDGRSMFDLETYPDPLHATWEEVRINWGVGGDSIVIQDTEDNSYTFSGGTPTFTANTFYYAVASLEDNTFRLKIYNVNADGTFGTIFFDTGDIRDDSLFTRRLGRIGWYASLNDGDGFVTESRSAGLTFGEYISHPMNSITPVKGLQLFSACTPNRELSSKFLTAFGSGSTVTLDATKSDSGVAFRIDTLDTVSLKYGAKTNIFEVEDFNEVTLRFAANFPAYGVDQNPYSVSLVLETDPTTPVYTFDIPEITPDVWQKFTVELGPAKETCPAGRYMIAFHQAVGSVTWYLDNASIESREVSWKARPYKPDAWGYDDIGWTPAKDDYNSDFKGVLFPRTGRSAQVSGRTLTQDAFISRLQILPRFAELGRLVWADETPTYLDAPTITGFSSSSTGTHQRSFSPTGLAPTAPNFVTLIYWSFGDGSIIAGDSVVHTFPQAGTYAVTVTAVDNQGNRGIFSGTVTVT